MKTDDIKMLLDIVLQRIHELNVRLDDVKNEINKVGIQKVEPHSVVAQSEVCHYSEKRMMGIVHALLKKAESDRQSSPVIMQEPVAVQKNRKYSYLIRSFVVALFILSIIVFLLVKENRKTNILRDKYELVSLFYPRLTNDIDSLALYPGLVRHQIIVLKSRPALNEVIEKNGKNKNKKKDHQ